VLEIWEGFASDMAIRFAGSSGGAATALALHGVERGGMHGTLHIAARPDAPYLNHTVLSTTRDELMAATGSRYAPASPCDGLQRVVDAPVPSVFIGKPCDVAGAFKARATRPELDRKLGLTIGVFCAGTPSTNGTFEMFRKMGVPDPESITSVRYRGNGWPGLATVKWRTPEGGEETRELTYEQSWGAVLQRHRQWRCYVCADHTGEFADIAVGDPWYRKIPPGEPGRSLIVVRTPRGREALRRALEDGYITAERVDTKLLPASQPNLMKTRGAVWGRLLVLWMMGAAVPRFRRMPMFHLWMSELTLVEKAQSIYGTMRRVFRKKLRKRVRLERFDPPATRETAGTKPTGARRADSELVGAAGARA
jgi:coenzyme F420 hydrogenase subunit beta